MEKPTIMFDYNNRRIEVKVPETIRGEVYKMGQTTTKFKPRYLYDFLAYRLGTNNPPWQIKQSAIEDFMWLKPSQVKASPVKPSLQAFPKPKYRSCYAVPKEFCETRLKTWE